MFAKPTISQSMIDAVSSIISEDEKKRLINDAEMDETGFHKAAHAAKKAGQSHFEFQGKKYPATAKSHKEAIEMEEGWDDMLKAVADRNKPQPSGGSGVKQGTRYGGSKQKDKPEHDEPKDKMKKESFRDAAAQVLSGEILDENGDCVTPPQAKGIAKKEVDKHEKSKHGSKGDVAKHVKSMHKEDFSSKLLAYAKYIQENKTAGTEPTFTDNNIGEEGGKMSDSQMKKREKIVMSMKDKSSYFKKKYGAKWKNVMYATATKQAMGEELNYEEEQDMLNEYSSDQTSIGWEEANGTARAKREPDDDRVTTDMLRGRVEGGETNDFRAFKVKLKTGSEKPVPEHKPGEDTKEKQKVSTHPGPVDIKLDDKLGSPNPYTYFSKDKQVKNEEVEQIEEDMKSFAKKAFKALTGGSDRDQLKALQRRAGAPVTGKKPVQKEDVKPPVHYGGKGVEGAKFDSYMQKRKDDNAKNSPKTQKEDVAIGGPNDPVHKIGVRGELKHIRSKEAKQDGAELSQFKKDHAPGKLVHKEEKVGPSDTARDVASKTFNRLRKETMMGKISN